MERPTGIIRTLPSLYKDSANVGRRKYEASVKALEAGRIEAIYIAMQSIPTREVLHMYLLIEGKVEVRLNIADYVAGDERECWDKQIRRPKYWAVCTGPVSRPEEPVRRRGFQGFRYTEGLW
jgi:hypothetical protein